MTIKAQNGSDNSTALMCTRREKVSCLLFPQMHSTPPGSIAVLDLWFQAQSDLLNEAGICPLSEPQEALQGKHTVGRECEPRGDTGVPKAEC